MDSLANRSWGVGQNLAKIRRRRGLTLEGLAELSSVSRASISALENGADNPRVQTLWNLADALGVNFGTLIGDDEDEPILEDDGISVRLIDRKAGTRVVEAYLMEVPEGVTRNASAHVSGVKEHVVVLSGEFLTGPVDSPSLLSTGQSVSFAGDVPHVYSSGKGDVRAVVTVVYPRLDEGAKSGQELYWPQNRMDWDAVLALITRATIEVQNGTNIDIKSFRIPGNLRPGVAAEELRREIDVIPANPSVRRFVTGTMRPEVLSLYRTSQMTPLPAVDSAPKGSLTARCLNLAALVMTQCDRLDIKGLSQLVADTSSLTESALAAEILTRNGIPTVPLGVGSENRNTGIADEYAKERLFEARIDVDAYEAYELVHPAYARQTLALSMFLPDVEGLRILDVGTGPGLPLAMLRELRPDLSALAVDPSEVAVKHLKRRFAEDTQIEIQQASIEELETTDTLFEAAVSIGASHHLDTSIFLSSIRERMKDGGILLVADEMITEFRNQEERQTNLIRHHLWYILDTLVDLPPEASKGDIALARRLSQGIPEVMGMAYSGRSDAARSAIRSLYEEVSEIERPITPSHPLAVFSRFHLLELQALIAGFDYEVEQKTHPGRFMALARATGFEIKEHQRIYATDGDCQKNGGTHLMALVAA